MGFDNLQTKRYTGFPTNVYQLQKELFNKLQSFGIPDTDDLKLIINLAFFDFESICVQKDNYVWRNNETKA